METIELLKKVRRIEIKTRGLSNNIFAGKYHSAFKGRGMAFSEVREYNIGDQVRDIDWNVSARMGKPYTKVFEEERELTLMLVIDISASNTFGTRERTQRELAAELAAVFAFSALQNGDKVGLILFSGEIDRYIVPKKGRSHVLRMIREIIETKPSTPGSNVSQALRYLTSTIKKRSAAFLISDFHCPPFIDEMRIAGRKHSLAALQLFDVFDEQLPSAGLLELSDAETGKRVVVDSGSRTVRDAYSARWKAWQSQLGSTFTRSGVDWAALRTDLDYVVPLMKLFQAR